MTKARQTFEKIAKTIVDNKGNKIPTPKYITSWQERERRIERYDKNLKTQASGIKDETVRRAGSAKARELVRNARKRSRKILLREYGQSRSVNF